MGLEVVDKMDVKDWKGLGDYKNFPNKKNNLFIYLIFSNFYRVKLNYKIYKNFFIQLKNKK
jgi:hypothetical protein